MKRILFVDDEPSIRGIYDMLPEIEIKLPPSASHSL